MLLKFLNSRRTSINATNDGPYSLSGSNQHSSNFYIAGFDSQSFQSKGEEALMDALTFLQIVTALLIGIGIGVTWGVAGK
jgi:hypothetical protein